MKIATWNLQRLDKNKTGTILEKLSEIDADIFVLTETNTCIRLDNYNSISTIVLPTRYDGINYKAGEVRVSILSKFDAVSRHKTFDEYTAVNVDLETPLGLLSVYGTIIGVFGHRQPRFDLDLAGQINDLEKMQYDNNICLTGDFNTMFGEYVYPSDKARKTLIKAFENFGLSNLTAAVTNNVDHILLSHQYLKNKCVENVEIWNEDKKLSDHIGIALTVSNLL